MVMPFKSSEAKKQYLKDYRRRNGLIKPPRAPITVEAKRARIKQWQQSNPDKMTAASARKNAKLKREVFDKYGGACIVCKTAELEFLTIDHVRDNGNLHRQTLSGPKFYRHLRDTPVSAEYQVLCWNHNYAKDLCTRAPGTTDSAKSVRNLRLLVIGAYGSKCACCSTAEISLLTIDHVHGGGVQHRANSSGPAVLRDARDRNYPPDYQILCHNCNASKAFGGTCTHHRSVA